MKNEQLPYVPTSQERTAFLDNAFVEVRNAEMNPDTLRVAPHRRIADLVAVVRSYLDFIPETPVLATYTLMEIYDVSEDELFETALKNTRTKSNFSCMPIGQMIVELASATEAMYQPPDCFDCFDDFGLYVLTNSRQMYGAGILALPELLAEMIKPLGKTVYILPSSIHEVLLLTLEMDLQAVKEIVKSVNGTVVEPREVLSDSIYVLDPESLTLKIIA